MMASNEADVVLASVHTLGRQASERLLRFDPKDFKCIIIDEVNGWAEMHLLAGGEKCMSLLSSRPIILLLIPT